MPRRLFALVPVCVAVGCGGPAGTPTPAPGLPAVAAEPADPGVRVDNPRYQRWAKHKVGTVVTVREKTVTPAATSETDTVYTLKEVTDEKVVVEVAGEIKSPDGTKFPTTPQKFEYPRLAVVPAEKAKMNLLRPEGTTDEKDATVTVLGREYKARWYKSKGRVEAGETHTETWLTDDLPGGLARTVHAIPSQKKTVTAEVVKVAAAE